MSKTKEQMLDLHYQLVHELVKLPERDYFGGLNHEAKKELGNTLIDLGKAIGDVEPQNLDDAELVLWLTGGQSMLSDYGI